MFVSVHVDPFSSVGFVPIDPWLNLWSPPQPMFFLAFLVPVWHLQLESDQPFVSHFCLVSKLHMAKPCEVVDNFSSLICRKYDQNFVLVSILSFTVLQMQMLIQVLKKLETNLLLKISVIRLGNMLLVLSIKWIRIGSG